MEKGLRQHGFLVAKVLALSSIAGAAALLGSVAMANDESFADEAGDGFHDIVTVWHGHGADPGQRNVLVHKFEFDEPPSERIGGLSMWIWHPNGDSKWERKIDISYNRDGSFRGTVRNTSGFMGHLNAFWVDDRTLQLEITKRLAARRVDAYKWRAAVWVNCPGDPHEGNCPDPAEDWVPSRDDKITHQL